MFSLALQEDACLKQSHTSVWQDMSHMGSQRSRTYSEELWLSIECVCVCVCLPLQHRLLNRCVLEVLWDYTPV